MEPDISMDRTRVDYGALMLGAALKETFHIVNREGMPHSFVFDKNSLGMAQVDLKRGEGETLEAWSGILNTRTFRKRHLVLSIQNLSIL